MLWMNWAGTLFVLLYADSVNTKPRTCYLLTLVILTRMCCFRTCNRGCKTKRPSVISCAAQFGGNARKSQDWNQNSCRLKAKQQLSLLTLFLAAGVNIYFCIKLDFHWPLSCLSSICQLCRMQLLFCKFHNAFDFDDSAYLFHVSPHHVCVICKSWVNFMYFLSYIPIWPSREVIQ